MVFPESNSSQPAVRSAFDNVASTSLGHSKREPNERAVSIDDLPPFRRLGILHKPLGQLGHDIYLLNFRSACQSVPGKCRQNVDTLKKFRFSVSLADRTFSDIRFEKFARRHAHALMPLSGAHGTWSQGWRALRATRQGLALTLGARR